MKHLFMTAAFFLLLLMAHSANAQVPPPPPKKQVVLVHPAIHKDKTQGQGQKKAASSTMPVQRTLPAAARDSSAKAAQVKH